MSEPSTHQQSLEEMASALHRIGAVQFGEFTLKDGSQSPVYCDLRLLISDASVLALAARAYGRVLADLDYDRIAAIPYAGLPIGAAVALEVQRPMIFPRKEVKDYGAKKAIEGRFEKGETVVVLDDLISRGTSKVEAIEPLEAAGLVVEDIVVLVDRRPAGSRDLEERGYRVHAAFTLHEIARALHESGKMSALEAQAIEQFLAN